MKEYGEIDSKFRFVILASKRAKQLLKGAKPKIKSRSKNLIRVAQQEVRRGMVEFEIIQNQVEDFNESDDDMFIGEEISAAAALEDEGSSRGEIGESAAEAAPEASAEPEPESPEESKTKPKPKKSKKKQSEDKAADK